MSEFGGPTILLARNGKLNFSCQGKVCELFSAVKDYCQRYDFNVIAWVIHEWVNFVALSFY